MDSPAMETAERNAQAIVAGNFMQIMADLTPEALAGLMQLGQGASGLSLTSLPKITSYTLEPAGAAEDGGEPILTTLVTDAGSISFLATWRQVLGAWKIATVAIAGVAPAETAPAETAPAETAPAASGE